jgi:hypothetical protein
VTDYRPDGADSAVHQALHSVAENAADEMALNTLAEAEVLVPVPETTESPDGQDPAAAVTLPVLEQSDGTQLVPVFTTRDRMAEALPQIEQARSIVLRTLADAWPSEDLSLVIDAGAPDEVALTAQGVKELLAHQG